MLKPACFSVFALLVAATVLGQTEPQKSPITGKTPPPGIHDANKRPAQTNPPPPIQTSPAAKSGEQAARPPVESNPRPIEPNDMDPSVKPADDFFMYADGGWITRTEIPPEYSL